MDFDDILERLAGSRDKPCLVQVGRAVGRDSTTYVWSTGRISATVEGGRVRIRRHRGVMCGGLDLDPAELAQLGVVCAHWHRAQSRWAAFYTSGSGYPPGYGCSGTWYKAPGRAERVKVAETIMGKVKGTPFVGQEEVVPLLRPRALRRGTRVTAEVWRRGEVCGPKDGSLVGLHYQLGGDLYVDADRQYARAWRKRKVGASKGVYRPDPPFELFLEPWEVGFVEALVELMSDAVGPSPPARS